MDDELFDSIKVSLQGVTVIPVPRVSRETLISILETHTDLIKSLKKENVVMNNKVLKLDVEAKENKKQLTILADDLEAQKRNIEDLFRLSNEFRKEMDELGEKVAELYLMKKQLSDQKEFIENLSTRFNTFNVEVSEFIIDSSRTVSTLQTSCTETQFQLKELKDYVDHFADNLVLSSTQITVDPAAGFAAKAINLTETLGMCYTNFQEAQSKADAHDTQISQIIADVDTKAPDSVLFNVNTLEKKVSTIEIHLQKEEEQGIGAIRKSCEELTVHVQAMSTELAEKIDRESVGFIVHEKYEEIVRYLQDALQSSLEDENNFKAKADEIQEMVIQLSNSKADRTEISNMQELMVKSEALLKKVGAQANIKERLKEFVSRKEVDQLLANKVDKTEMEQQLSAAVANNRRTRKMTTTGMPTVDDAINKLPMLASASSSGLNYSDNTRHRPQSGQGVNSSYDFSNTPAQQSHDIMGSRVPISAGDGGHNNTLHSQSMKGEYATPSGSIPVIAIGRALSPPKKDQKDFTSFAKNKKTGGGKPASMSLPTTVVPGAFRTASEGGKPGGWDRTQAMTDNLPNSVTFNDSAPGTAEIQSPGVPQTGLNGNSVTAADGYGRTEYPFVPPSYDQEYSQQSATTDHMAYLHGPMVGGGFNAKSQHMQKGLPAANSVPTDDVEGKGLMLKGADGHLYYKDLEQTG